jgi:hypothetical protein
MAEEKDDSGFEYLPYDTEYLTSACTAYATLVELDEGLMSKSEAKKLSEAKKKLVELIVASTDKVFKDYFGEEP